MNRFESAYAKLVDRLVVELVALSKALVDQELEKARAQAKKMRAAEEAKKKREAPRVSARLQRALERAEEARRRAAERRAAALAARAAERPDLGSSAKIRRVRSKSTSAGPAPVIPPPLFVHKRSRDGSIQHLERGQHESAPPPPPA